LSRLATLLLDLVMGHPALGRLRARTLADVRGRVLELGVGTGRNLPLYGPGAEVLAIDPDRGHLARARRRAAFARAPVRLLAASAEALPFPDSSLDGAVSTWCLCSIPDLPRALAEVRRVLAPGAPWWFVGTGSARIRRWRAGSTGSPRSGGGFRAAATWIDRSPPPSRREAFESSGSQPAG